jgi:transposase-like protein
MKAKRKRHDATFKARVALEALKGNKTVQQIAAEYEIHPGQVSDWKRILAEGIPEAFERKKGGRGENDEFEKERGALHSKIGELTVKLDFLQKKSRQLGL